MVIRIYCGSHVVHDSLYRNKKILKDNTYPGHKLFALLPSGKRYRRLKSQTNRLKNSFYLWAICTMNRH